MTASLSAPGSSVMGRSAWLEPWLATLPAPSGSLEAVQVRGRRALREQPLPSSRQEDWRFTDLSLLQQLEQAHGACLLYTSPSPRDRQKSRMPSSA